MILAASTVVSPGSSQEPGINRNLSSSATIVPPTTMTPLDGCSTSECHPGIKEHSYLHGPLQVNACDACHALDEPLEHRFVDVLPRQQLCTSCHDLHYSTEQASVHQPLSEGECLSCHDPHGSEQPRAILHNSRGGLCLDCHAELSNGEALSHAPESEGSCNLCHQPHSSQYSDLLIKPGRALCLSCHVKTAEQLTASSLRHAPTQDDCRVCHDPHATDAPSMLVADPAALCLSCHQEIEQNLNVVVHPHAAMTEEKSCLNCHQPHASNHGQLLRGATQDLCFQCHNEVVPRKAGGSISNIQAAMEDSPNTHSPAQRGDCTLCHQVHGGDRDRLLKREYVPTYASFQGAEDYSLCFSCHDKNLVLTEQTSAVTAFRNGDQNLHFVHVNSRKSRSCNICHDPHAADSDHMIRPTYPFGPSRWELAIAWKGTPDGGSCAAGCHAAFEYDRQTPVIYTKLPNNEEEWRGRMPFTPGETIPEEIQ